MSAPIKTFVLRLPSRPAGAFSSQRCCASLTQSTARSITTASALRPSRATSIVPQLQQLTRNISHTSPAQKSATANQFRPASDLASKKPAASPADGAAPPPLDWNTFFKLRLRRRRIQVFFSATMGVVGFGAGAALLPTGIAEPLVAQIPLDPFISLGMLTVAFAGVGWLVGPSIGSQVFYLMNHRVKAQIAQKEAEFFARIKKNRVDPTNSSAANPGTFHPNSSSRSPELLDRC